MARMRNESAWSRAGLFLAHLTLLAVVSIASLQLLPASALAAHGMCACGHWRDSESECIQHLCSDHYSQYASHCPSQGDSSSDDDADSSYDDGAAQRAADVAAAAERQRRLDDERQREAAERRRQQEFEAGKAAAIRSLKGVSHSDPELKGTGGNTAAFGLKGINGKVAGLQARPRGAQPFADSAFQQLSQVSCAGSIADQGIQGFLEKPRPAGPDLEEMRYIEAQAIIAYDGGQVEVECDRTGEKLKFRPTSPLPDRKAYLGMLKEIDRLAEARIASESRLSDLHRDFQTAKQEVVKWEASLQRLGGLPPAELKSPEKAREKAKVVDFLAQARARLESAMQAKKDEQLRKKTVEEEMKTVSQRLFGGEQGKRGADERQK